MSEDSLLIVDDEVGNLKALRRLFQKQYSIFTALSAQEAFEILEKENIGVIISDQRMPEMCGDEFLKIAMKKYPDTVRYILSGYADFSVVTSALNSGVISKFLLKPWENDLLLEHVQNAFDEHKRLRKNDSMRKQFELRDIITNLPNFECFKRYLNITLSEMDQEGKDGAVCLISILKSAEIHVELGITRFNKCLKKFGEELCKNVNGSFVVARICESTFGIIIPNYLDGSEEFDFFVENFTEFLKSPFIVDGFEIDLQVKMGLSIYPKDGISPEYLVRNAQQALIAKQETTDSILSFYKNDQA